MWLDSSSDEDNQIYCNVCQQIIDSQLYINHWKNCNKKQEKQPDDLNSQSQSQSFEHQLQQDEGQNEERIQICAFCGQNINLVMDDLNLHLENCEQSKCQCQYCFQKINALQLEQHQQQCGQNNDISKEDEQNNVDQNQDGDRESIENNEEQDNEQVLSLQQIMQNHLLPALTKIDNAIKKKSIDLIPIIPFRTGQHAYQTCAICLQDFIVEDRIMKLRCSHIYHEACSKNWLIINSSCSICKTPISVQDQLTK